jgi:hypothetical protein
MPADVPVTYWIGQLKAGDERAAQKLWEEYFSRLVVLARGKLRGAQRRVADEEDVALSAFDSFCRGAEGNRFPRLDRRAIASSHSLRKCFGSPTGSSTFFFGR